MFETRGETKKEAIAGIVPERWFEWGLGEDEDPAPRPP